MGPVAVTAATPITMTAAAASGATTAAVAGGTAAVVSITTAVSTGSMALQARQAPGAPLPVNATSTEERSFGVVPLLFR